MGRTSPANDNALIFDKIPLRRELDRPQVKECKVKPQVSPPHDAVNKATSQAPFVRRSPLQFKKLYRLKVQRLWKPECFQG